jgi:hypothetical protein
VKPVVKPTVKPNVKPTVKVSAKPSVKPTVKPMVKPTVKPTVKPLVKASVKPSVKPLIGQTRTPNLQRSVKPAVKPILKANVKPIVKPVVKNRVIVDRKAPTPETKSGKDRKGIAQISKLTSEQQQKAKALQQKNLANRDSAMKPGPLQSPAQPGKAAPAKLKGSGPVGLGLLDGDLNNLSKNLGKSKLPADQSLLAHINNVNPLTNGDIKRARDLINDPKTPQGLKNALHNALVQDQALKIAAQSSNALAQLAGLGSLLSNLSFPVNILPGQPGPWPGLLIPEVPGELSGAAVVTSVVSESATIGDSVDGAEVVDGEAVSDVWQTARYLRLGNDTKEKVRIWVQYYTEGQGGAWDWSPAAPGKNDALVIDLDPGEVTDLKDGDWRVNGQRVRIWAQSESKEWATFKNKDLWLVPEVDSEGNPGYVAAEIQTFNFTIR